MPGIEDYRKWVEEAKPLIGASGGDLYEKRNNQVAEVLQQLQSKGSKAHIALFDTYQRLASEAQKAVADKDQKKVESINSELKTLKDQARNAIRDHQLWQEKIDKIQKKLGEDTVKASESLTKRAQARVNELGLTSASVAFIAADFSKVYEGLRKLMGGLAPNSDTSQLVSTYGIKLAELVKSTGELIANNRILKLESETQAKTEAKAAAEAERRAKEIELKKKQQDLLTSLAGLEDVGVEVGVIAGFKARIPEVKSLDDAAKLSGEIAKKKTDHENNQKTKIKGLGSELEALGKQIEAKKKELKGNDNAVKALDALGKEASQLIKLAESNHPDALDGAHMLAKRIERIVKTTEPDGGLGQVYAEITEIGKTLDDKDLQKYCGPKTNQLKDRLKKLTADVDPFDLPAAEAEIASIKFLASSLVEEKDTRLAWQGGVRKWLESIHGMVDELNAILKGRDTAVEKVFGSFGDLLTGKTLMANVLLKEIEEAYQQPGANQAAIDSRRVEVNGRMRGLMVAAKNPAADASAALQQEYDDANKDAQSREDAKSAEENAHQKFQENREKFKKELEAVREKVEAKKGPKAELDTLEKMSQTAKTMEKNGDRKGALERLEVARKRLAALNKHPGGFAVNDKNELDRAAVRWNSALDAVGEQLNALAVQAAEVAKSTGNNPDEVGKRIKSALAGFDRQAFNSAAKLLEETLSLPQRKKLREEVLVQVRRHRSILQSDPVIDMVRTSPFKARVSTAPIRQALDGLELNALRAVPAE